MPSSQAEQPRDPEPEADAIKRQMVDAGVPTTIVLTEDKATNTGETLFSHCPYSTHSSVFRIFASLSRSGNCTSRRYLMTLQRHWRRSKMLVAVNWFGVPRQDWHLHPFSRARVLREYEKIAPYIERGFIAGWSADAAQTHR
jgi:hypothetical protein